MKEFVLFSHFFYIVASLKKIKQTIIFSYFIKLIPQKIYVPVKDVFTPELFKSRSYEYMCVVHIGIRIVKHIYLKYKPCISSYQISIHGKNPPTIYIDSNDL